MWSSRMVARVSSARFWGLAQFDDMALEFNKIGSLDGTGKANIVWQPEGTVFGVVYELDLLDLQLLDTFEKGYHRSAMALKDSGGNPVQAEAYISQLTDSNLRPTQQYKDFVVGGALEHQLPICYIQRINQVRVYHG